MKYYYYLFYKLYKFTEDWGFWPEARAFCLVILLNFAFLGSLLNCYTILTGIFIHLPSDKVWLYLLSVIIVTVNYLLLLKGDKKDRIIKRFDAISPQKNSLGDLIIFLGVVLLIITFILSLFMLNYAR